MGKLSENIALYRERNKFSKEQLAAKSGLSYYAVNSLENKNRMNPNMTTLIKLADALDISLDELVGRKPRKKK